MWMSARWAGIHAMLVVWMLHYMDWRRTFQIFGGLGVIWAVLFYRWFRDNPGDHPSVNAGELALLEGTEARIWSRERALEEAALTPLGGLFWIQYFVCLTRTGSTYVISDLPSRVPRVRRSRPRASGFPASVRRRRMHGGRPDCGTGCARRQRGQRPADDRIHALPGSGGAAVLHTAIRDPLWSMVVMDSPACERLGVAERVGRLHGYRRQIRRDVSGSMNMMGNLAGGAAPVVVGYLLNATNNNGSYRST